MVPILQTKLFIPHVQSDLVLRPRLMELLQLGAEKKLILVSAPAGFGKTTVVSQWLEQLDAQVAWLSLDVEDDHLPRFLSYLIASIQTLFPGIGHTTLELLSGASTPSDNSVIIPLLNDLAALTKREDGVSQQGVIIVLDDYHLLQSPQIHQSVLFLLENAPKWVHFVITSRSLPPLAIARLRARNQMLEVREKDLRFSEEEAHIFFDQRIEAELPKPKVKVLKERTEGWIAGMQMAAISMKASQDLEQFLHDFSGNDRFITDYLMEEVLNSIPQDLQTFLLQTSLLQHLHGPLCDAVIQIEAYSGSSQDFLERLETNNLFIVELDRQRQWYRLHHLFADLLRQRFCRLFPEQVAEIHKRAGFWYEQADMLEHALEHAFASKDLDRSCYLLDRIVLELFRGKRHFFQSKSWYKRLPQELTLRRPRLALMKAFLYFGEGIEHHAQMETIADKLEAYSQAGLPALREYTKEQLTTQHALGFSQLIRAAIARQRRESEAMFAYSQQALHNLPEEDKPGAYYSLGVAHFFQGKMVQSAQMLRNFFKKGKGQSNLDSLLVGYAWMLEVLFYQGEHRQLRQTFQEVADTHGHLKLPGVGMLYILYASLLYEENALDEAERFVQDGIALCHPFPPYFGRVLQGSILLSRIQEAKGKAPGTVLENLETIPSKYVENASPHPSARVKARKMELYLELNDSQRLEAFELPQLETNASTFACEADLLCMIRYKLSQKEYAQALEWLDLVQTSAEQGGRLRTVLTAKLLRAQLLRSTQKEAKAISTLKALIGSSKRQGFLRLLIDDGSPLQPLFVQLVNQGFEVDFIKDVLPHLRTQEPSSISQKHSNVTGLVEALSARETEVLQLLATGLSNRKMADQLFISSETIKSHLKNIYGKLGVRSRTEAVYRAKALHLIS